MAQNFSVYKSSAGSGKTTTLVREYLRLSLRDPDSFHRIIALTFTNKATFEMKARVLETLSEIINSKPPFSTKLKGTLDYLCDKLKVPEEKIVANAAILLSNILHNYGDFAFSTLDGFVVKIVKAFAYELKLPSAFDVELDSNVLLTKAVDLLLDQVGTEKELTDYLVKYLIFLDENERQTSIEKNLLNFGALLFQAKHYNNILDFENKKLEDFDVARRKLERKKLQFENEIRECGNLALELIHSKGLSSEHFLQGTRGVYGFFLKSYENAKATQNSYAVKAIVEDIWTTQKKESFLPLIMDIKVQLIEFYNRINLAYEQMRSCSELTETLVPTALFYMLLKNVITVSEGEGLVHLSDMNNRIQQLVENEASPFIYERIGQRINHFLVDEFQDTSKIQWQNLVPLLENSLSENKFNMLVGDAKQAIYRWREGDLQQFVNLPNLENSAKNSISQQRENVLKSQFVDLSLNNNYRSAELIVQFNNQVLSRWIKQLDNPLINKVYGSELKDNPIQKATYAFLRVDFIEESDDEEDLSEIEKVAMKVVEQINCARSHRHVLSNIAVLARGKREIGAIADELKKNNIPFVSADALQVASSKSVQFVVAVLNWLHNPLNQVNKLFIVQQINQLRKQELSSKELSELINFSNLKFVEWVNNEQFNFDYYKAKYLTIYESVEYIIRSFHLYENADQLILHFVDMVLKYSLAHGSTLQDFIELWNEKLSKETISGANMQADAVQLLTFHKAKGLEFEVVINVLWSFKSPNSNAYAWVDVPPQFDIDFEKLPIKIASKSLTGTLFSNLLDEEERESQLDDLNLNYVALTRPKLESYLILAKSELKEKPNEEYLTKQNKLFSNVIWDYVSDTTSGFTAVTETSFELQHLEFQPKVDDKLWLNTSSLKQIESNDWNEKLQLKQLSSINYFDEFEQKRQYGELLHALLSKVDSLSQLDDLIGQPQILLKQSNFVIHQLQIHAKLLQHYEKLQPFFSEHKISMKETAILVKNETFRPDRVVFDGDEIRILDYKVTSFSTVSESILVKYKKQLAGYKKLLEIMYSKKVLASLLFIGDTIELIDCD